MTDNEVRALLAQQPQSETLPHPAATVAILQRHVEDATDDVYAVERWIAAQAGERRIGPAAKSVSHRIGNGYPRWEGPFRYYVIPVDALRQPSTSR